MIKVLQELEWRLGNIWDTCLEKDSTTTELEIIKTRLVGICSYLQGVMDMACIERRQRNYHVENILQEKINAKT